MKLMGVALGTLSLDIRDGPSMLEQKELWYLGFLESCVDIRGFCGSEGVTALWL